MSSSKVVKLADIPRAGAWVDSAVAGAASSRGEWGSPALTNLLERSHKSWKKLLFPSMKSEQWRYTNAESLAAGNFVLAPADSSVSRDAIEKWIVSSVNPHLIVLVNGRFSPALSSVSTGNEIEPGVSFATGADLGAEKAKEMAALIGASGVSDSAPFAALSTLLMQDVVVISVARSTVVARPIQILSVSTSSATNAVVAPRIAISVAEGADVSLIESYASLGASSYLSLPVVECFVAEQARLRTTKVEDEDLTAYHIAHSVTEHARNSFSRALIFSFGGKLVRNSADIELKGPGCDATINGLTVLDGEQHVDNTTSIHHIEPACESRELFKGIYAGKSKGVFSGTIVVESEAQKTNAFQSNQTLLLSPTASIDTRPQLKIWADDVKCTHGATIGQLDEMALFYLRSRGISQEEARRCLVKAFASEVVSSLDSDGLEEHVLALLTGKLEALQRGAGEGFAAP